MLRPPLYYLCAAYTYVRRLLGPLTGGLIVVISWRCWIKSEYPSLPSSLFCIAAKLIVRNLSAGSSAGLCGVVGWTQSPNSVIIHKPTFVGVRFLTCEGHTDAQLRYFPSDHTRLNLSPNTVCLFVIFSYIYKQLFDSWNCSDWCCLTPGIIPIGASCWLLFFGLVFIGYCFLSYLWFFWVGSFLLRIFGLLLGFLPQIDITNVVMIALPIIGLSSLPLGWCHY